MRIRELLGFQKESSMSYLAKRIGLFCLFFLTCVLGVASVAVAQDEDPPVPQYIYDELDLHKSRNTNLADDPLNARVVQIDARAFPNVDVCTLVFDGDQDAIENLTKSNFSLTEQSASDANPVQENISVVADSTGGTSLALVIDRSGSMSGNISQAREAAKNFVDFLAPSDRVAVFSFSDSVYQLTGFTNCDTVGKSDLKTAIDTISTSGQTRFTTPFMRLQKS